MAPCGRSWRGCESRQEACRHSPAARRNVDRTGEASYWPLGPRSRDTGPGPTDEPEGRTNLNILASNSSKSSQNVQMLQMFSHLQVLSGFK